MQISKQSIRSILAITALVTTSAVQATVHKVHPGDSIQAAINAAIPGDTILVDPGTYQENVGGLFGLRITQDNIRLIGKTKRGRGEAGKVRLLAIGLEQEKHGTGINAAPAGCDDHDAPCNAPMLKDIYIRGFTVEGFGGNGIQANAVDGFKIIRNESVNNLENGIFPVNSANGLVRNNISYGSTDTALWVEGSENVRVVGNELYDSVIGFEITVSNNVTARSNKIHNNTIGIGMFHPNAAGGSAPKPVMANWVIEDNEIYNNNRPNIASPTSYQGQLPPGAGILLLGVSNHTVRHNEIEGHGLTGIAVMGWCTATFGTTQGCIDPLTGTPNILPITDPSANNNLISENELEGNGWFNLVGTPFENLQALVADLTYASAPAFAPLGEISSGNCFIDNVGDDDIVLSVSAPYHGGILPTDGC